MCTNTLQKDCGNDDPMVRGLALRSELPLFVSSLSFPLPPLIFVNFSIASKLGLCSLNLPQMVEYISEPLRKALQDHSAYVRKTGVMGILKLYHLDQESFEQCGFVDILYDM